MRLVLSIILMAASVSFSDIASQTDWSGGGGVPGPISDWGNSYDVSSQVNEIINGVLRLGSVLVTPIEYTVDGDFDGASSVYATDLLGAANLADDITWWENTDGIGTVWTEHTVDGDFDGAISVYAIDVNGDGDTDVLGAAADAADITWWYVMCYSVAGTLESSILNAGTVNCWEVFLSTVQEPAGTSVGFQFRSSQGSTNMGAWSDTVFTTGTSMSGILADSTNYLQYKVILQTKIQQ